MTGKFDNADSGALSRWSRRKAQHNSTNTTDAATTDATPHTDSAIGKNSIGIGVVADASSTDPLGTLHSIDAGVGEIVNAAVDSSGADKLVVDAQPGTDATESDGMQPCATDDKLDVPLLTDEDMPDIDSLSASSDVSMFFNRGVSKALRKAALATIFKLPAYNVRDGLNDYDEDYTVFEPLGDTITCDMKFHTRRRERERLERERLEQEQLAQEQAEQQQQEQARLEQEQEQEQEQEHEQLAAQQELEQTDDATQPDNNAITDKTEPEEQEQHRNIEPALLADTESAIGKPDNTNAVNTSESVNTEHSKAYANTAEAGVVDKPNSTHIESA